MFMELAAPGLALTFNFDLFELKYQAKLSAYCPVKGMTAVSNEIKNISVGGESALWWHCSCCRGWHVLLLKNASWSEIGLAEEM